MSGSVAPLLSALDQARTLAARGDFPAMLALLVPLPPERLLEEPELGCLLAWAWRNSGEPDEARELLDWLTSRWGRRGNDPVYRMALHTRAVLHLDQGELENAARLWEELLQAASEAGDHRRVSRACNGLGVVDDVRCRFAEGLAWYERALSAAHRAGDMEGVGVALNNVSICYLQLERLDAAMDHNDRALLACRAIGIEAEIANVEITRCSILLRQGDLRFAEAVVKRARHRLARHGTRVYESSASRLLGVLRFALGNAPGGIELLRDAARLAESLQLRLSEAEAWHDLAGALAAGGDAQGADRAAELARRAFRALGAEARAERVGIEGSDLDAALRAASR